MASTDQGIVLQFQSTSSKVDPAGGVTGAIPSSKGSYGFPVTVKDVSKPDLTPVTTVNATNTVGIPRAPKTYKMRAKDTGAGFVFWVTTDPNSNYPGTPVGSIVDKQIAAILPV
jgi:hypothetical protein